MRSAALGAAVVLGLAGCVAPTDPASNVYPGGTSHSFRTPDGKMVLSYACAPEGPGRLTVEERAAKAHAFLMAAAARNMASMLDGLQRGIRQKTDQVELAVRLKSQSSRAAEQALLEMNRRYACFPIGSRKGR